MKIYLCRWLSKYTHPLTAHLTLFTFVSSDLSFTLFFFRWPFLNIFVYLLMQKIDVSGFIDWLYQTNNINLNICFIVHYTKNNLFESIYGLTQKEHQMMLTSCCTHTMTDLSYLRLGFYSCFKNLLFPFLVFILEVPLLITFLNKGIVLPFLSLYSHFLPTAQYYPVFSF